MRGPARAEVSPGDRNGVTDMDDSTLLIYGATGYTGRLVTAEAVRVGLRPVLAGRNRGRLATLGDTFGIETRVVRLDDAERLATALEDVAVVLHCAGPFSRTWRPMYDACLATGTHYLDITGEIDVFEALAERDRAARDAGIMLLPGVGFDVVPSDCLIADLAARYPGGRHVRLGLAARTRVSRGTARSILESVDNLRIRREGRITRIRPGQLRHEFDFGTPPAAALVSALGDVSTAWWSTGIANIESYGQATRHFRRAIRISRWFGWLLAGRMAQRLFNRLIDRQPDGPSDAERRGSHAILVAEIEDAEGRRAAARVRTPDPYGFTATVAVAIAARAAAGDVEVGFQTPSSAYGADLLRTFDGVRWELLDDQQPMVASGS